jgi:hypothetical protein
MVPTDVTDRDAGLLVEVGLPSMWFIEPDRWDVEPATMNTIGNRRLLRLGRTEVMDTFLDLETGAVVGRANEQVDPDGEVPESFVNSDLAAFQRFSAKAQSALAEADDLPYEAGVALAQPLRAELEAIDRAAFQNENSLWATWLEEWVNGL